MAYFAEINSENLVLRVVVAGDDEVLNYGGHGSEEAANRFKKTCDLSTTGVKWIESFKDGTRGKFGGLGHTWNEEHQIFCEPQTYSSWTLNTTTGVYEPPITKPSAADKFPIWDEDNERWYRLDYGTEEARNDPAITQIWDPNTSTWS